jgi:hypothetical protein
MQEKMQDVPLKTTTAPQQGSSEIQRVENTSLPPVFSDTELSAVATDYPLTFQYLSQLEEMTENRAAFIISVAKFYGWKRDDSLQAVVQGWEPSYCPIQFFTFGGEGL